MEIIGICGRKGSGKSTLGAQLGGVNVPFAMPLKEALITLGVPGINLYNPDHKEVPLSVLQDKSARHAMVTLGTEWGRKHMGPRFWTYLWKLKLWGEYKNCKIVVVDDVRFIEEVEAVYAMGGELVAVEKPNQPKPKWWKRVHASEALDYEALGIDVIVNDGTPEQLLEKFNAVYKRGT